MGPRGSLQAMRIAFVVSRLQGMDETWTTIHLAHKAALLGHDVRFMTPGDIEVSPSGRLVTRTDVVQPVPESRSALAASLSRRNLPRRFTEVPQLDVVFVRVNPLTPAVLGTLLLVQGAGPKVINDPSGIARTSTKAWLATLPDVPQPRTLVTRSRASAELFAGNLEGPVVVKPAIGSGGRGVFLARTPSALTGILDRMLLTSLSPVVVQQYVPEASLGEKRLFLVDSIILGAYRRLRNPGEFRHNLRQGAHPEACEISEGDRRVAAAIGPHLARNGIRIAGLDVIGEKLVEVNTLNPGGVHFAEMFGGQDLAGRVMARLLDAAAPHEALPRGLDAAVLPEEVPAYRAAQTIPSS
jgi:glutathione synthase